MKDKIVTTKDLIDQKHAKNINELRASMAKMTKKIIKEGDATGKPVEAFVDFGRWVARCECNGAEIVDPESPEFFCYSCGNASNNGRLRPVSFPKEMKQIEEQLLSVKGQAYRNWDTKTSMDELKAEVEQMLKDKK